MVKCAVGLEWKFCATSGKNCRPEELAQKRRTSLQLRSMKPWDVRPPQGQNQWNDKPLLHDGNRFRIRAAETASHRDVLRIR